MATIGDAAALARERERLLVAGGVVLADRRERLVFVADEHGGPHVAVRAARGLSGPSEQRLHPRVLEEDADGAGQRRVRTGGHVEREHLAVLDQVGERRHAAAEPRHGPDVRDFAAVLAVRGGVGRRRAEHARHVRLVEQRQEHADALDDRGAELGVERHPVVSVPSFDGLDLLGVLTSRAASFRLRPVFDLQLVEPRRAVQIEPAGHLGAAGRHVPAPVPERLLVVVEILGGDDGPHGAAPQRLGLRLPDLPGEQLRVHRAAVDVAERDPAPRQEPVKLDDPPDEVRVRLLPERFARLAEELVDERGDAVRHRVGVEQRIVERVPLPRAAEPDLQVVVLPVRLAEDAPDLVAEISLDLEHERARAAAGIVRLPGEKLPGERVHAGGGLAGADGADDEDAGVESLLGDDEPGGAIALGRDRGVVQFADDERGRVVVCRGGPCREPAPVAPAGERLKPDPRDREHDRAGEKHGHAGREEVPDVERPVQARIVVGDQVEVRVAAGTGERREERAPGEGRKCHPDEDERPRPHRSVNLPVGILGAGATQA